MRLYKFLNENTKYIRKLEDFKKDLKKLTKIYKNVDDENKFPEARKLFHKFADNWEEFIYGIILLTKSKEENYIESQVRFTAWIFQSDLRAIFPDKYDIYKKEDVPNLIRLNKERDKNIRRYQKSFREAYKIIKEYLEGYELKRTKTKDKINYKGIDVNIDLKSENRNIIQEFLGRLDNAVKMVKRAGFERALKDLTIHLREPRSDKMEGGIYNQDTGEIDIYLLGAWNKEWSIVHEIGHRYYFKSLPIQAIRVWDSVIKGDIKTIMEEDIKEYYERYISDTEDLNTVQDRVYSDIKSNKITDLRQQAIFKYLADNARLRIVDKSRLLQRMKLMFDGQNINVKYVTTDYGATDPWEAFAEAFKLYVVQGPGALDIWTATFFRNISKTGGAKMRESKVEERLQKYIREEITTNTVGNLDVDSVTSNKLIRVKLKDNKIKSLIGKLKKKEDITVTMKNDIATIDMPYEIPKSIMNTLSKYTV